jgi:hypothetical protein
LAVVRAGRAETGFDAALTGQIEVPHEEDDPIKDALATYAAASFAEALLSAVVVH